MAAEILVFGSINADLVFPVESLPRPGETVIGPSHRVFPGGKGANQAVAAARAGARVRMAGCVGRDGFGAMLRASLAGVGVDISLVRDVGEPTGCAAIGVDRAGANQIMVSGGANLSLRAADVPKPQLSESTTLLMQMEVTLAENWALARRARERGARVVLNFAPAAAVPLNILELIDVLVVNEGEALAVARQAGESQAEPLAAARWLAGKCRAACVVTLGAAGAVGFGAAGGSWRVGALPVEPVDTTAAGDCFVGWLGARLAAGDDLPVALRWASVAAGVACEGYGAQPSLPGFEAVAARLDELGAATVA